MELSEQVAIVTGGSRGIGRAVALRLARNGARVLVNYRRQVAEADKVVALIREFGGDAFAVAADVQDEYAVEAMAQACLERWGRIDLLVNNAGMSWDTPLFRMTDQHWHTVIETNLTSVFFCCRAVLGAMRARAYGRIVNVGSLAGLFGNVGQSNYAAAKAGLIGLTRSLARECALDGITVNVVAPAYIETDFVEPLPPLLRTWSIETNPMRRFGTAEEVAAAIAFFGSPAASYITGQVLAIDGGWVMP
ncbi:3-oxoacyl-ACP reductase FabG [Candidatus Gracilibacteria bacterium]|nr:3-oxoacyl-ACP reductase FabG [Candidatus Gracilibacteria bacterium]